MRRILVLPLLFGGCPPPDYGFPDPPERVWGEPNPADPQDVQRTDRVLQVIEPIVDALWVVDNSRSMDDDRAALAANFPLFIEPFQDAATDWHVGVISTDMERMNHGGRLVLRQGVRWVDSDSPDPVGLFTDMTTTLETSITGLEKGREAVWRALAEHEEGVNAGFRREGAYLHVTVVSDEDDDTLQQILGKSEFVDFMNEVSPSGRNSFNSVVAYDTTLVEERGAKYMDLTDRLGGVIRDINGDDWSTLASELGGLQAPPPTDEFFLSAVPVPDTIEVLVVWAGITWVYVPDVDYVWEPTRNSIQFTGTMPPMGAAVEITYTMAASQVLSDTN